MEIALNVFVGLCIALAIGLVVLGLLASKWGRRTS